MRQQMLTIWMKNHAVSAVGGFLHRSSTREAINHVNIMPNLKQCFQVLATIGEGSCSDVWKPRVVVCHTACHISIHWTDRWPCYLFPVKINGNKTFHSDGVNFNSVAWIAYTKHRTRSHFSGLISSGFKAAEKRPSKFPRNLKTHIHDVCEILPRYPRHGAEESKTFFKVVNVLIQWENVENHRRKYEAGEWYRRSFEWGWVVFGVNTLNTKKRNPLSLTQRPPLKK